jgi:hypothetical protein
VRRLLCWVFGHRWDDIRVACHRAWLLSNLHWLAGAVATCDRCGAVWDDVCDKCRRGENGMHGGDR